MSSVPSRVQLANAIRALSMDAVQKAQSGHPGCPMGMADIAQVVWGDYLRHHPQDPRWINRDRFVLSNGHGSMLLYSLLHLTGYDLPIEALQHFRQCHSQTPGHPEYGETPGVETTTGPLGQGFANAVGMALAERLLGQTYNREKYPLIDHWTYVFVGDGCLMEGISHEVASLAGTLQLGKLIVFWDDNGISIDGPVKSWFSEDTARRFEAYQWHVCSSVDGHDPRAVIRAIDEARQDPRPSLICCRTLIGYGAPTLAGTAQSHGAPLGEKEIAKAREKLEWPYPPFVIPEAIREAWDARAKGKRLYEEWQALFKAYRAQFPLLASELERRLSRTLPSGWHEPLQTLSKSFQEKKQALATRKASHEVLGAVGAFLPELLGGSADLTESNLTCWEGATVITPRKPGNYLHYGVREFGMCAMMNGIALYGGFIPYGGTFLTFVDYARNAVRMAALMRAHVIFVFTHDSIGLGEDGPTHQPIEHMTMLRATPHLHNWRPCDSVETVAAWVAAIARTEGPCSLVLTRQKVPTLARDERQVSEIAKGGYVLVAHPTPQALLIATGSEVSLCIEAEARLRAEGIFVNVVSLPCWEVFEEQSASYKERVLPPFLTKRVAVEAGARLCWHRYVGPEGQILGLDRYGLSGPSSEVYAALDLTTDRVVQAVKELGCGVKQ